MKNNLQLGNEKHWIKFVCDVKKNDVSHNLVLTWSPFTSQSIDT